MKITIIHPVQCDGKALKPGSEVDLPNEVADGLVACGAAEPVSKKSRAEAESKSGTGDAGTDKS